jgi:hypothetical protein
MKALARQDEDRVLVDLEHDDLGVVVDLAQQQAYRPSSIHAILARGYWLPVDVAPALPDAKRRQAEKLAGTHNNLT